MKPNWFIGWPLTPGAWFEPLVATAPRPLRRFHADDLHITLAFLGPVGQEAATASWALAESLPLGPLGGTLAGLAAFGNPRAPSAFSLEVHGEGLHAAIAEHRGPLLEAAGAPPDHYAPRAHCTVARPRRDASGVERATGLAWARLVPPLNLAVNLDRLALYTWSEERRERQFQIVRERTLDG